MQDFISKLLSDNNAIVHLKDICENIGSRMAGTIGEKKSIRVYARKI